MGVGGSLLHTSPQKKAGPRLKIDDKVTWNPTCPGLENVSWCNMSCGKRGEMDSLVAKYGDHVSQK